MSMIFERYIADEQTEKDERAIVDVPPCVDDGADARKRLMDNVTGGTIKQADTIGVWL